MNTLISRLTGISLEHLVANCMSYAWFTCLALVSYNFFSSYVNNFACMAIDQIFNFAIISSFPSILLYLTGVFFVIFTLQHMRMGLALVLTDYIHNMYVRAFFVFLIDILFVLALL